ncbi:protein-L-isoaspartate O-methyltransferase family protein [Mycobacterium gordonae]|uniref:protein-L-isoaspartate O-methyltransferase family protein n=1 Tax=Mycobacterium gordonae TaxID=1778 RepID=UPI001C12C50C
MLPIYTGFRTRPVLEIGTGSGYNAALLANLAGENGAVVSVDIDDDLIENARARLAESGVAPVTVGCGDGALGGQVQGRGVRRHRVILRGLGSGSQCRGGVLLFCRCFVDAA